MKIWTHEYGVSFFLTDGAHVQYIQFVFCVHRQR